MFDLAQCKDGTLGKDLDDQELEDEICAQASRMAAGECHLVLLAAEMDRRGTWAAQGVRSMAHWLNWRVGTSLHAAREQVRVGRALAGLPLLRGAFASGELSYSKARAISRVASANTEASLVDMARYATASQLELITREYRKADPDEGKDALRRHQEKRYFRHWTDDESMVHIKARLPPEEAATVLGAVEAAREAAWRAAQHERGGVPGGLGREEEGSPRQESTTPAYEAAGPQDRGGVPAGTPITPEASDGPPADLGDVPAGTPEPAPTGCDPDDPEWDDLIGGVGWEDLPGREGPGKEVSLEGPAEEEGLFSREGAGGPSPLGAQAAAEEREVAMADALVLACEVLLKRGFVEGDDLAAPPFTVFVHVDDEVLANPDAEGCSYAEGIGAISSHTARRLACSSAARRLAFGRDGSVRPDGRARSVPRRLRQAVLARDRGCRFPGCTQRRYVDVHHVVFWAEGGPTAEGNLVALCRRHHRLVPVPESLSSWARSTLFSRDIADGGLRDLAAYSALVLGHGGIIPPIRLAW